MQKGNRKEIGVMLKLVSQQQIRSLLNDNLCGVLLVYPKYTSKQIPKLSMLAPKL